MIDAARPPALAGLSAEQARAQLVRDGRNEVRSAARSRLRLLWDVVREPMLLLLLVATALYIVLGDTVEAIALGASVAVIVVITLLQERRTARALASLRELASPSARVLRDGAWVEVDARELVRGDVLHVGEGDRVPADAVLRAGAPITVDESLLTGESVPVVRTAGGEAQIYAGTLVTSGNALAEVVATGPRTELGRIGAALGESELARPPLQQEVAHVVREVATIALAMCVVLGAIHLLAGNGWVAAILAGVTLAMALLPEELPLVTTVFLTLGARRIARDRVLARSGAAIETLGTVTVLCVDKTGTLTRNRMAIARLVTPHAHDVGPASCELPEVVHEVIEYGLLACPQRSVDPMDRAFGELAARTLETTEHVHPAWQWVHEYPLSPGLLAVTHVWRDGGAPVVVATKGAPEAVFDLCHLAPAELAAWSERAGAMAQDGLRVLAVAHARYAGTEMPAHPHAYDFVLAGLVGLADPLRDDTAQTIATCHRAGVRVLMITGDHPLTARAIARAAGLRSERVLAGAELDTLDDTALGAALVECDVIARAAPAHKLRIIQALRARGEVVGMTGDGVNDAPALHAADVGIAMGHGTDVAREAAGLVLVDDALAAIVGAIRTGRTIYDNLRKVASYLLAVHVPIAALALLLPVLGWPLLLGPIHVVLLELLIDPTCSIVFEVEPPEPGVMDRPPRGRGEHLFEARRVAFSLLLGAAAFVGPFGVVAAAHLGGEPDAIARTLGFVALIAADVALVTATRGATLQRHRARNPAVRWMLIAIGVLVATTIALAPVRALFAFAAPGVSALALAVVAGAAPVLLVSLARR